MKRGDVVLVDYPFSEQSGSKVRPAVVVLADLFNRKLAHTIVAPMTSSLKRFVGDPSQLIIDPSTPEGRLSGLPLRSVVLGENLATVRKSLILRVLGYLPDATMRQLDDCLRAALGL